MSADLPVGLFVQDPSTPESRVQENIGVFMEAVTEEFIDDIERQGYCQIIVPLNGGTILGTELYKKLLEQGIDSGAINVIITSKDPEAEEERSGEYHIQGHPQAGKATLVDDIYDYGGADTSIRTVLRQVNPKTEARLRTCSRKTRTHEDLDGFSPVAELKDLWVVAGYYMNGGITDPTRNRASNMLIETLARFSSQVIYKGEEFDNGQFNQPDTLIDYANTLIENSLVPDILLNENFHFLLSLESAATLEERFEIAIRRFSDIKARHAEQEA